MPTYAVLLEQKGEGCGSMIGCGKTWDIFEAEDLQHAHIKAKELIMFQEEDDSLAHWGSDRKLEKAILVEIKATLPTEAWFSEFYAAQKALEKQSQVDAEKNIFERLKAKYG